MGKKIAVLVCAVLALLYAPRAMASDWVLLGYNTIHVAWYYDRETIRSEGNQAWISYYLSYPEPQSDPGPFQSILYYRAHIDCERQVVDHLDKMVFYSGPNLTGEVLDEESDVADNLALTGGLHMELLRAACRG